MRDDEREVNILEGRGEVGARRKDSSSVRGIAQYFFTWPLVVTSYSCYVPVHDPFMNCS